MTSNRPLAATLAVAASGLFFITLSGCPDQKSPAHPPPPPVQAPPPPPPQAPPAPPKEGWGLVGVGSSFESVTKYQFDNPDLAGSERRTVQTVVGFDPDGVRLKVVTTGGDVPEEREDKIAFKATEKDPDAKKLETTKETLTVSGKSYDCDVTTEKTGETTKKTWSTKSVPVPLKIEVKGGGLQSTTELVKIDLK